MNNLSEKPPPNGAGFTSANRALAGARLGLCESPELAERHPPGGQAPCFGVRAGPKTSIFSLTSAFCSGFGPFFHHWHRFLMGRFLSTLCWAAFAS